MIIKQVMEISAKKVSKLTEDINETLKSFAHKNAELVSVGGFQMTVVAWIQYDA